MRISIGELAEMTGGEVLFGGNSCGFENITTSSKIIKGSDLFVPIVGEKTDGHLYIASAFDGGAEVSLTQDASQKDRLHEYCSSKGLVYVPSTAEALLKFAKKYKQKYIRIPFIGVTGSVGKTTTREMITRALSGEKRVYSTKGNANSQVGVPITVFETDKKAELAVVELGISEFGEMEKISSVASVETAVMTNIGISHLAQFQTQENILKEKLQILSGEGKEGRLLVNGNDPFLGKLTEETIHSYGISKDRKITVYRYGVGENCDYRGIQIEKKEGFPEFTFMTPEKKSVRIRLAVPGDHMVLNAVAALAVCDLYGLDLDKCAGALETFGGFEGRGNIVDIKGVTVINDSYNASPVSMKSGLSVFQDMKKKGRKIAVLADMKELGPDERDYHREIGEYLNVSCEDIDELAVFGELAEIIGKTAESGGRIKVRYYTQMETMKKELWEELKEGDMLFLKGSWSMGLKRLIE